MGSADQSCRFAFFNIRKLVAFIVDFDLDRTGSAGPRPANFALLERIQQNNEPSKVC
jgi:hypothetical protein